MNQGIITAVYQDQKQKQRYHLYINEQFAFSIHEDILIKFRLFKGTEIDQEFWQGILDAEERHKAYLQALRYLGFRPRSARQLYQYLLTKGYTPEIAEETRQRCETEGYVDDAKFAEQWVQERSRLKGKSGFALRMELQQKGIGADKIADALEQLSPEDEWEAARKAVWKKIRNRSEKLTREEIYKLCAMLQRKGFSPSVISRIKRELDNAD
ncbi:RecX family transcriptional regulator [Brevibacillus fulvus]|uniref:Regulatory protein RecX n=1 Tax=Brevibacillus fulvus TaxID=1125967 RepID=A0A938XZH0_9BACL|nr:RecX family transcriptional regulator [Brevibacillus fulvus]MBM7590540.1 regulatory protein [Brevibacillus fulvus]